MKNILITGAAGVVGTYLRRSLAGKYHLRLSDIVPIGDLETAEEFVQADVADLDAFRAAADGVQGIIHLGGIAVEDSWDNILEANFVGTYNMYEAARHNGVGRVIFASSNHAIGFYPREQRIGVDVTVRPDSRYGVSKAFGEAMGSLYVDKYGLEVLAIRIGNVADKPVDRRRLGIWVSPRDLTQLVEIGLERPDLGFQIVYGVSDNKRGFWDNANATRLGYRPEDRSEDYADEVLAAHPAETGRPALYQGGTFVEAEKGGDPSR